MKKILFGIRGQHFQDSDRLCEALRFSPSSNVGLQLPNDYLNRETNGLANYFFIEIASILRTSTQTVIPLEDSKLYDESRGIELAGTINSGLVSRDELRAMYYGAFHDNCEIEEQSRTGIATVPETVFSTAVFLHRYAVAWDLVWRNTSLDELVKKLRESNACQEAHMLSRIEGEQPDILVVEDAHAIQLKDRLPQYAYVCLCNASQTILTTPTAGLMYNLVGRN